MRVPNNGAAISLALAEAGARVAVSDLRPDPALATRDAVRAGVAEVERELGAVDVLVNNAGTLPPEAIEPGSDFSGGQMGLFTESDPMAWHRWIDLNLYGSLNCIHAVLRGMTRRGWGRVIQISSTGAARGLASGHSTYGAGKAAVEAAMRHIAIEVARTGVTLYALALGPIGGVERASNADLEKLRAAIPVGRQGEPGEVAGRVLAGIAVGRLRHRADDPRQRRRAPGALRSSAISR